MVRNGEKMRLGFSLAANGTHKGGWRHPDAHPAAALDIELWRHLARTAEEAKFHYIFFADGAAVRTEARDIEALSFHGRIEQFEPLTLIAALSAVTEKIGFIATASTSYNFPYTIARKYASLDYLSHGRVGWNVVTGWSEAEAKNFGRDTHYDHADRYEMAEEFVDVVRGLWDSWEDDAFVRNKESGRYFNPDKLHLLNHVGKHYKVKGPLNIARPPQGYPVIAQAGQSDPGQEMGARTADIVYTAQTTLEGCRAFYNSLKGRLPKYGRSADSLIVMPGVLPIIGETMEEAKAKRAKFNELLHPEVGLAEISRMFGDLTGCDLDGPPPPMKSNINSVKSLAAVWNKRIQEENLTIRQLYESVAMVSGHWLLVGTPQTIADSMESWFQAQACDGFSIMLPYMPKPMHEFIDLVLPELRRRNLFQTEYTGDTLRQRLGLPRPENMFAPGDRLQTAS